MGKREGKEERKKKNKAEKKEIYGEKENVEG